MSQQIDLELEKEMLPEYDFSKGLRGKHHEAYKARSNVSLLNQDLAKALQDSAAVI